MKKIRPIIIYIFLGLLCYIAYKMYSNNESNKIKELEKNTIELMQKIEKVSNDCDSLKKELNTVKCNTDTLKRGQAVIYNEVKKSNTSFWDRLF